MRQMALATVVVDASRVTVLWSNFNSRRSDRILGIFRLMCGLLKRF